jgi:hypothetical protein
MTIQALEREMLKLALVAKCDSFDTNRGEVGVVLTDEDGRRLVHLRFPYQSLDDLGLPRALWVLYQQEIEARKAKLKQ